MKKAILLALLLGGCDLTASQEHATDANVCSSYGFAPGTAAFANCQMTRDRDRQAQAGAAIDQIGRNNRENLAVQERELGRPTVTCNGIVNGNTTQTTCR